MIESLACHVICCDSNCDWVSQLVTFNHMLNYVSTQLFSLPDLTYLVPFLWLDIISFSLETWLNWVWFLFLIPSNYLDSNILPFTFRVECSKRRSQSYSGEYYWSDPYLTKNTQRCYILIGFPAAPLNSIFIFFQWFFMANYVNN